MKIGIVLGSIDPHSGGEGTLIRTLIKCVMRKKSSKYEYVFLYVSETLKRKTVYVKGYKFIPINNCCGPISLIENGLIQSFGAGSSRFYKLDRVAKREGIDLFYFAAPLFAQTSYPYIYTVWDLGHRTTLYFPEVSKEDWGCREKKYQSMLPRASYVITGNETGKEELLKYYNLDEERIRILPFPVSSFCYGREEKPAFELEKDYFFYPAQFWSHKNHICILDALAILKSKYDERPAFYFTGCDKGNMAYIQQQINDKGLDGQVKIVGFLSDKELKYMYTHAKAMVYASLLGPNNLPPIESLMLNCPVLLTDIPGHVEQMGKSVLYFDGFKPESLAELLHKVINNDQVVTGLKKNMEKTKVQFDKVDYFSELMSIFDEFSAHRERWKRN